MLRVKEVKFRATPRFVELVLTLNEADWQEHVLRQTGLFDYWRKNNMRRVRHMLKYNRRQPDVDWRLMTQIGTCLAGHPKNPPQIRSIKALRETIAKHGRPYHGKVYVWMLKEQWRMALSLIDGHLPFNPGDVWLDDISYKYQIFSNQIVKEEKGERLYIDLPLEFYRPQLEQILNMDDEDWAQIGESDYDRQVEAEQAVTTQMWREYRRFAQVKIMTSDILKPCWECERDGCQICRGKGEVTIWEAVRADKEALAIARDFVKSAIHSAYKNQPTVVSIGWDGYNFPYKPSFIFNQFRYTPIDGLSPHSDYNWETFRSNGEEKTFAPRIFVDGSGHERTSVYTMGCIFHADRDNPKEGRYQGHT